MAFDETAAYRVREVLADRAGITEKKMFGGLAFMVEGYMCVGLIADELMVRVGPEQYAEALAQPHARSMDFTGRPMKGFVYVASPGYQTDDDLRAWVGRGLTFVSGLPPK